jgi:hypothetical protein
VSLAAAMTSFSDVKDMITQTGPKISSREI